MGGRSSRLSATGVRVLLLLHLSVRDQPSPARPPRIAPSSQGADVAATSIVSLGAMSDQFSKDLEAFATTVVGSAANSSE